VLGYAGENGAAMKGGRSVLGELLRDLCDLRVKWFGGQVLAREKSG
jgi:hypothetical protein